MYFQCIQFVFRFRLKLHTPDSDWTVTETQTNRRGILLFTFSCLSVVLYTTIINNVNLRNILINITENKEHLSRQNNSKILTFSMRRLDGRNDVLDVNEILLIIFPGTPHLKPYLAALLKLCVLEIPTVTKYGQKEDTTQNYVLYAERGPCDLKWKNRDKNSVRGLNESCVNKEKPAGYNGKQKNVKMTPSKLNRLCKL